MAKSAKPPRPPAGSMAARFDLMQFTDDLIADLRQLRAGEISAREAAARAELAKQVLRSVGLVIQAQKFIEARAKEIAN